MKLKFIFPMMMVAATLLATSCSSRKAMVKNDQPATTITQPTATANQQNEHVAKIAASFGRWETMKAGGSVAISGSQSLSSSMQIRMERGKSIFISVRPLGLVEVGRLVITGDTIIVIDKVHKRYICENVKLVTNGLPVNVSTLQDLFLGRAFVLGKGTFDSTMANLVKLVNVDGSYMIYPKDQYEGFEYDFKFDKNYKIQSVEVIPATGTTQQSTYSVNYSDVKYSLAGNIASKAAVSSVLNRTKFTLTLEYSGFTWNEDVKIDTSIPSNYKKVSGSSLLNMFQQ